MEYVAILFWVLGAEAIVFNECENRGLGFNDPLPHIATAAVFFWPIVTLMTLIGLIIERLIIVMGRD